MAHRHQIHYCHLNLLAADGARVPRQRLRVFVHIDFHHQRFGGEKKQLNKKGKRSCSARRWPSVICVSFYLLNPNIYNTNHQPPPGMAPTEAEQQRKRPAAATAKRKGKGKRRKGKGGGGKKGPAAGGGGGAEKKRNEEEEQVRACAWMGRDAQTDISIPTRERSIPNPKSHESDAIDTTSLLLLPPIRSSGSV